MTLTAAGHELLLTPTPNLIPKFQNLSTLVPTIPRCFWFHALQGKQQNFEMSFKLGNVVQVKKYCLWWKILWLILWLIINKLLHKITMILIMTGTGTHLCKGNQICFGDLKNVASFGWFKAMSSIDKFTSNQFNRLC